MIKIKDIVENILAATRDQFVLKASRDIVNAFKSGQSRYEGLYPIGRSGETLDVQFKFYKRPNQEHAFSIGAFFGPSKRDENEDVLEAIIEYRPKMFPGAMNAFIAEIKETLEHEYEHVGQQTYEDKYIVSNRYDEPLAYPQNAPQAPTHFLYLTNNREVPAYVRGLVKRARVKKISFDQAVEEYYNDYKNTFTLYNTDWSAVKRTWMKWYDQNKQKLKKTL